MKKKIIIIKREWKKHEILNTPVIHISPYNYTFHPRKTTSPVVKRIFHHLSQPKFLELGVSSPFPLQLCRACRALKHLPQSVKEKGKLKQALRISFTARKAKAKALETAIDSLLACFTLRCFTGLLRIYNMYKLYKYVL